jgi:hypothetical protein
MEIRVLLELLELLDQQEILRLLDVQLVFNVGETSREVQQLLLVNMPDLRIKVFNQSPLVRMITHYRIVSHQIVH